MRVWFKRLVCALEGHPVTVSHLEMFDGVLRATSESCDCGRRGAPVFPGHLLKLMDQMSGVPTVLMGGTQLKTYGEDTH